MKLRYYTNTEIEKIKSNMFVIDVLHKRSIEVSNPALSKICLPVNSGNFNLIITHHNLNT